MKFVERIEISKLKNSEFDSEFGWNLNFIFQSHGMSSFLISQPRTKGKQTGRGNGFSKSWVVFTVSRTKATIGFTSGLIGFQTEPIAVEKFTSFS
jgi:hypothetical protein